MEDKLTVIFDFDGTLANTIELVGKIYNNHAHEFGAIPVDLTDLDAYRKLGYKKAMKKAKIRWTVLPRLVLFVSKEMKQHMAEVPPYPGVVNMLKNLQKAGISIGVLTSNNAALVNEFFKNNNFPVFDFIVSEKTLFGKEKALRKIIKRHKLEAHRVVYVGDEPRDVTACYKAGIKVIGVTWGVGGRIGLEDTPPDRIVDTADQLETSIREYQLKEKIR
ncbi:HAD-IA family hydrolase [Candidatus Saccharibacteria bacterium]|nr:HAD-IA family hydrolase [Candidatus Saccharibacteria bacterium]